MIYLDNSATSFPKPNEVYEEVISCMKNYAANPGRGSHKMAIEADEKIMETRNVIARLFNIDNPLNIIFTNNATEALNIGIKGILNSREHVISTVVEHNSVLRPLKFLTKRGTNVTLLGVNSEGFLNINDMKKEVRKNTKAIIINHASNVIGSVQDLESIGDFARKNGIIFMVDASQSAGALDIDVKKNNINILAFPGHKGLFGPQGTGGLYIDENLNLKEFKQGGTGSNSNSMDQPNFLPDKFESGTLNTPGIAGLCEGIKFINRVGIGCIKNQEMMLVKYFVEEMKKLDYIELYGSKNLENRCAVVSFNIKGKESSEVGYLLNKKDIAVRTGYHCAPLIHGIIGTVNRGTVRVSPGYFNTLEDMEYLIRSVVEIYNT